MGQGPSCQGKKSQKQFVEEFTDLNNLPPEIAVSILSNLNATDLCLASCVWKELAEDELLWRGLCHDKWRYTSVYNAERNDEEPVLRSFQKPMYKSLYLILDEATLIFRFRPQQGIDYLIDNHVVADNALEIAKFMNGTEDLFWKSVSTFDNALEIAKFMNGTENLFWKSVSTFLQARRDVLDELVELQDYTDCPFIDAVRRYFARMFPPEHQGNFLVTLVDKFADRYLRCNPECGFAKDSIGLLCYSLLLLSVDLYSPHVKNKMTKREFIRNNRQVIPEASADLLGDMYDDVYLNGHIAANYTQPNQVKKQKRFPFYRPYGAVFELKPMNPTLCCG